MRLLVVDDDENARVMLRLLLARSGWDVVASAGAEAALGVLRRERFDWLVVDGQLPPGDGFQLAARAKALQPGLRVVMVSGFYEPRDIAGSVVERLFPKPVDADALLAYLKGEPAPLR